MFYIVKLTDKLTIYSKQIGPNILSHVKDELKLNYEGKILGRIGGYIVNIIKISDFLELGKLNVSGNISYNVTYYAVVFLPKNKQLLDVVVTENEENNIKAKPKLIENDKITCIVKKDLQKVKNDDEYNIGSEYSMYIVNNKVEYSEINIIGYIV